MKKSGKKPRQGKPKKKGAPVTTSPPAAGGLQTNARWIAGGVAVFALVAGIIGYLVMSTFDERDLTAVGAGQPMIVQVHDVQCQTCNVLQREVRAALGEVESDLLGYRVADLKSEAGLAFASQYGAGHSTLLLFDGSGNLTRRISYPADRERLVAAFNAHAETN
ncbi:MAG: hypothetical protein AAFU41_01220 [Pseudomonadota bacterium]